MEVIKGVGLMSVEEVDRVAVIRDMVGKRRIGWGLACAR